MYAGRQIGLRQSQLLGRQVFIENCAVCHGPEGYGHHNEIGAVALNYTGHAHRHSDQNLTWVIETGITKMPSFADQLSDREIRAVIAFIKTLWTDEQRDLQGDMTGAH